MIRIRDRNHSHAHLVHSYTKGNITNNFSDMQYYSSRFECFSVALEYSSPVKGVSKADPKWGSSSKTPFFWQTNLTIRSFSSFQYQPGVLHSYTINADWSWFRLLNKILSAFRHRPSAALIYNTIRWFELHITSSNLRPTTRPPNSFLSTQIGSRVETFASNDTSRSISGDCNCSRESQHERRGLERYQRWKPSIAESGTRGDLSFGRSVSSWSRNQHSISASPRPFDFMLAPAAIYRSKG